MPSEFLVKILSARPELSEKLINHSSSLVRLEALKHVKDDPDMDWVASMFSCLRDDEPTLIHKLKTILIERGMCLDIFIFDGDKSIAWFAAQEILNNDYEIDYSMVDAAIKVYSQSSMPSDIEMCDILKRIMQTQENRNYPDSLEP
ncbi:MAG: hypothetical protein D6732_13575 [Methanobacteriota archaeon]|nr:MAG: hypothetical protein D6732_13575 [Euryarchaeota archaeon]